MLLSTRAQRFAYTGSGRSSQANAKRNNTHANEQSREHGQCSTVFELSAKLKAFYLTASGTTLEGLALLRLRLVLRLVPALDSILAA